MMTARRITLAKLEKKLAGDTGAILTASEVLLLTRELQRHMAASFPALASELLPRADDTIRWHSLETRCRHARAARGLSIRDVAVLLHIPQYRLKAFERGAPARAPSRHGSAVLSIPGDRRVDRA